MQTTKVRPALLLALWTFGVWTTRIRNIWADAELSLSGQVFRTTLALVFTGFAMIVTAVWVVGRRRGVAPPSAAPWIRAFALWTAGVWLIRGVQIALAGHSIAFVAVHTALAVVSIGLAWWAYRSVGTDENADAQPVAA